MYFVLIIIITLSSELAWITRSCFQEVLSDFKVTCMLIKSWDFSRETESHLVAYPVLTPNTDTSSLLSLSWMCCTVLDTQDTISQHNLSTILANFTIVVNLMIWTSDLCVNPQRTGQLQRLFVFGQVYRANVNIIKQKNICFRSSNMGNKRDVTEELPFGNRNQFWIISLFYTVLNIEHCHGSYHLMYILKSWISQDLKVSVLTCCSVMSPGQTAKQVFH